MRAIVRWGQEGCTYEAAAVLLDNESIHSYFYNLKVFGILTSHELADYDDAFNSASN